MTSLEQQYLTRQEPGTLQNRAVMIESKLHPNNGAAMVEKAAIIGRHTAQLVYVTLESALPFVRSYHEAVPILGRAAEIARQDTVTKDGRVVINPTNVLATKLT